MVYMPREQTLEFYHYSTRSTIASIFLVLAGSTSPRTLNLNHSYFLENISNMRKLDC